MYTKFALFICVSIISASCQRSAETPWVEQKYVHKYGIEVQPDFWDDCGRNGQLVTTQRDGVVVCHTYSDGRLDGPTTYTFPHCSQPQRVENYCNDALVSIVVYNYSGTPIRSTEYSSPNSYVETNWYESGHPHSIERYDNCRLVSGEYYNERNQCDCRITEGNGERITRDAFGHQLSVDTFTNGVLVQKMYHYPNGSPKEITPFYNGQISGERKMYHPGGEPMSIENWNDGKQHGMTVTYRNGEKFSEIPYQDGRKHGIEKRYNNGSEVVQEVSWNQDQQHGPSKTFVNGNVQTDYYYYGRPTSQAAYESFGVPKQRS